VHLVAFVAFIWLELGNSAPLRQSIRISSTFPSAATAEAWAASTASRVPGASPDYMVHGPGGEGGREVTVRRGGHRAVFREITPAEPPPAPAEPCCACRSGGSVRLEGPAKTVWLCATCTEHPRAVAAALRSVAPAA
jgi:hypothetical protein